MRNLLTADGPDTDLELEELARTYATALAERPSPNDATALNWIVLGLVIAVSAVAVSQAGWRWPWQFDQVSGMMTGLVAILAVQIAVLVVGVLDYRRIRADLRKRSEDTVWAKTATVAILIAEQRDPDRAFRLANQVFNLFDRTPWALRLRARARMIEPGLPAGRRALLDALRAKERQRRRSRPYVGELELSSRIRERIGRLDEALDDIEEAIDLDDENANLWMRKGDLYRASSDLEKARSCYEAAILIESGSKAPLVAMARFCLDTRRLDDAVAYVQQAAELEEHDPAIQDLQTKVDDLRRQQESEKAQEKLAERLESKKAPSPVTTPDNVTSRGPLEKSAEENPGEGEPDEEKPSGGQAH